MAYRMLVSISGTRNGQDWPRRGELVDLPADEAEHMIRNGQVERAADDAPAEPAGPPTPLSTTEAAVPDDEPEVADDPEPVEAAVPDEPVETATVPTKPARKR